jgi:hypothetical protein
VIDSQTWWMDSWGKQVVRGGLSVVNVAYE